MSKSLQNKRRRLRFPKGIYSVLVLYDLGRERKEHCFFLTFLVLGVYPDYLVGMARQKGHIKRKIQIINCFGQSANRKPYNYFFNLINPAIKPFFEKISNS